ncbi:MAG: helix-hairpin-helix domain-containing protein [Chlorobi bacterium]|nr:helix-hairpin-helix domain-containing protein [Chlorobiota bacterium]
MAKRVFDSLKSLLNRAGFTREEQNVLLFFIALIIIGSGYRLVERWSAPDPEDFAREYQVAESLFHRPPDPSSQLVTSSFSETGNPHDSLKPRKKKSKSNSTLQPHSININAAGQSELEALPGIGPATAKKIIRFREQVGRFKKPSDIKKVKGIGDKKFKKIEPFITTK